MLNYVEITTILSVILLIWVAYRISKPFACNCGYRTIIGPLYVRHLMKVHRPILG